MKIWIDISNAPHVNFFKEFIDEWQKRYEVVVTTRPLSNTIDLLEENNIDYHIVGSHYGKKKLAKLVGFFKRSNELYRFLKSQQVDISISQSSFYSPYVANKLNIPCIYTNDNEFAKGNYVGFLLASHVLLPEALKKWTEGRFFEKRVSFYPGVKEGIYIKQKSKKVNTKKQTTIYFRPEPWHAQYHEFSADTFDKMLTCLAQENKIFILPRDQKQTEHFKNLSNKHRNIVVPSQVHTVDKISENCDIFLGAGGSMTREFAVMGIPTVSMYQDDLLEVDKYLIECGELISEKDPSKIDLYFINKLKKTNDLVVKPYSDILDKGKEARNLINKMIEKYNLSAK